MKKLFKNRIFKFSLKAAISIGFLTYVIYKVDWIDVWENIKKVTWWQTIIYVIVLLLGMILSSYKWKILSDYKNFKIKFFDYFKFYLAGTFINNFMPSFVGGDAYKTYQLGKNNNRYTEAASTVMADRITGLVAAMILSLFFSLLNFSDVIKSKTLLFVNFLIVLSLFLDLAIIMLKKSEYCRNLVEKLLPSRIIYLIKEIYSYNKNRKTMKKAILLAMAFDIIGIALVNYILFWSLGIRIDIIDYLSVIFLTSIVASIPISINNIGIKEWAYITFFGALGISSSPVITVAILSRALQTIVSFFALPVYLKGKIKTSKVN